MAYTRHTFRMLGRQNIEFSHYVIDNGSSDDTPGWLSRSYHPAYLALLPSNVGISKAMNMALDALDGEYDVVVKMDNDCELPRVDTLREVCEAVLENHGWLLSPRIEGLRNPVPIEREHVLGGRRVGTTGMIGGIFLAAPGWLYQNFRHDEGNPTWGLDDVLFCQFARTQGFATGYLLDHVANHYPTTDKQHEDYPEYFSRKYAEGSPK